MKVSLIICTYNHAKFIERAIASALNQSLDQEDYEVIVVNDGSTDNTEHILLSYKDQVRVLHNEGNKGLVFSCNRGIKAARGRYLVRLDSDDEIDGNLLLFESAILDNNDDIGCVYSDRIEIADKNREIVRISLQDFHLFSTIACGIMFRKALLEAIGLYDDLYFEEYDLLMRYLPKHSGYYLKLPLYKYYIHGSNMTLDWERVEAGRKELVAKWGLDELRKWGYDEWSASFQERFDAFGGDV